MNLRFRLPLAVLVFAMPMPLLAQSAQDFRLPPAPTPTPTSNVQGPVDTESGVVPVRPREIPTARPTPAPSPTPAPRATPTPVPSPRLTPVPTPTVRIPQPRETAPPPIETRPVPERNVQESIVQPSEPAPNQTETADPALAPVPLPPSTDVQAEAEVETTEGENFSLWLVGLLALLALGLATFFFMRRRKAMVSVPQIERPVVGAAGPRATLADIRLDADAVKLTRSMAFATLDYRITLLNRAKAAGADVVLGADLVTAHGNASMESQVASADQKLEERHTFARIAPGQTVRYEGKLQLPLSEARIIRQGNAPLMVPLLRVRLDREGDEPVVRTFVVGQGFPGGGKLAPFRLDEGPRSYSPLGARALD
ncbi:hypothetical protein [Erythrobacter litoralis]|uniref:hypothetical protein n=1 Tax=Erythrobacter litoralis TaxID=39960 RepID=UPI00243585B1|nr:hypothetical protein [Erythrobacter litoralis]